MELVNSKYMIEVDDILDNSELTQTDLNDVFKENLEHWLKNLSLKTYRVMYSAYRGIHRKRQATWLDWFIQQDTTRRDAIRDAIIEYIRGAVYSGLDMQLYVSDKKAHSEEVENILKENGLWILSTVHYLDEELV